MDQHNSLFVTFSILFYYKLNIYVTLVLDMKILPTGKEYIYKKNNVPSPNFIYDFYFYHHYDSLFNFSKETKRNLGTSGMQPT